MRRLQYNSRESKIIDFFAGLIFKEALDKSTRADSERFFTK